MSEKNENRLGKVYHQLSELNSVSEDMMTLINTENSTYTQLLEKIRDLDQKIDEYCNNLFFKLTNYEESPKMNV